MFLVPVLLDEFNTTPPSPDGAMIVEAGSKLKIIASVDDSGRRFLPSFTDWEEIRKWKQERVDAWVMPAADVWSFVLAVSE